MKKVRENRRQPTVFSESVSITYHQQVHNIDNPLSTSSKWADFKELQLSHIQKRKKKNLDQRASKGRKVRTHVHEKLIGFMPAEPRGLWSVEKTRELFKGLFGACVEAYTNVEHVVSRNDSNNEASGSSGLENDIVTHVNDSIGKVTTNDGLRLLA